MVKRRGASVKGATETPNKRIMKEGLPLSRHGLSALANGEKHNEA